MPAEPAPDLSVVVPMLDAEARLPLLHDRLSRTLLATGRSAELILVDDRSSDRTWEVVRSITAKDATVTGVRLATNVGQVGALCAGFQLARGDVVVMMDDDLETDPEDLVHLVVAVDDGADFASGWRRGQRSPLRAAGSWAYNTRLRRRGYPFHDAGCGLNAMTRDVARQISAQGWLVREHRFKPYVATITERIVEVPVAVRKTTESHQTLVGLAASWLDVEVTTGAMSIPAFIVAGIALPGALGAAALVSSARSRAGGGRSLPAGVLGSGCLAITGLAWRTLACRQAKERRASSEAPWSIAETAARCPSRPGPVGSPGDEILG